MLNHWAKAHSHEMLIHGPKSHWEPQLPQLSQLVSVGCCEHLIWRCCLCLLLFLLSLEYLTRRDTLLHLGRALPGSPARCLKQASQLISAGCFECLIWWGFALSFIIILYQLAVHLMNLLIKHKNHSYSSSLSWLYRMARSVYYKVHKVHSLQGRNH